MFPPLGIMGTTIIMNVIETVIIVIIGVIVIIIYIVFSAVSASVVLGSIRGRGTALLVLFLLLF